METPTKKRKVEETPPTTPSKMIKTAKSKEYFILKDGEKKLYECMFCHKIYSGSKSSNLTSHLATKHKEIHKSVCSVNSLIEYKRLKLLHACVETVTINGRPFRNLNDSGILLMNEDVLQELKKAGREFHLNDPHLKEVKENLTHIAQKVREKISKVVQNRAISLLVDIVTKRGRSLLGVSIQYIMDGKVITRSIGMIHLEKRHTGAYLAELIINRLKELGIDIRQIITITTDNGANVLKMVRDLESHLQETIHDQLLSPSKANQNNEGIRTYNQLDDEAIEREIEAILASEEEREDENDHLLEHIFDEAEYENGDESYHDGPTTQQVEANENLLAAFQYNMSNSYGLNVMWDVSGVNCAAHTLQLAIDDAFKAVSKKSQNTMELCHRVALFMRKQTTICMLKGKNIVFKKPRIDVATRWGSKYLMMLSVYRNKDAIIYLADTKNIKIAKLLRKRWAELIEIIQILQVPFKATIALQSRELTLPDAYGIWLKTMIHLRSPELSRLQRTDMGECLFASLEQRKGIVVNNTLMQCALYLDPRYRCVILRDREIAEKTVESLVNLSNRIESIHQPDTTANHSASDCDLNVSIDFDNSTALDDFLANGSYITASTFASINYSIEEEIECFQPGKMLTSQSVIGLWEQFKNEYPRLYKIAIILYAIPPTEVQIERDFSDLEFIFTARRYNLSSELLEAILIIHLNKDLFEEVKKEELADLLKSPVIDLEL